MSFDGKKPFGQVSGSSIAVYEQDGTYYDGNYQPLARVDGRFVPLEAVAAEVDDVIPDVIVDDESLQAPPVEATGQDSDARAIAAFLVLKRVATVEGLHWTQRKKLAESLGHQWITDPQCLEFLNGQ